MGVVFVPRASGLDIAKGYVPGHSTVNKFGIAPAGVQTSPTDIWDRADATPTQQIWLAPTAARIHTIASTSANDTTGGTGANSVIVYYLPDWDTAETTEIVTGNLNAGIAMSNAAVMIHRKVVIPQSTSITINVGTITATAAVDGTVTSAILPGKGQTQMAIYGIPSTQTLFLRSWYASMNKSSGASAHITPSLLYNPDPGTNPTVYLSKETRGLQDNGTSSRDYPYEDAPKKFPGPGILKVNAIGSVNDLDADAGFNAVLVDNEYIND